MEAIQQTLEQVIKHVTPDITHLSDVYYCSDVMEAIQLTLERSLNM